MAVVGAVCLLPATPAHAATAWTAPFALAGVTVGPVMAADGTTVYPETTTISGQAYAAVQVRPPGGSLGGVQALGRTSGFPAVAAGPDGRFVAAWPDSSLAQPTVQTAVMMPGATSFGDIVGMPSAGDSPGYSPGIAVDAAGNASLIYSTTQSLAGNQRSAFVRAAVRPASGSPTSQIVDSLGPSTDIYGIYSPQIAVSDAGAAIASWQLQDQSTSTSTNVAAVRPTLTGAFTRSVLDTASSGTTVYVPSVAMGPSGQGAVVWGKVASSTLSVMLRYRATGAALSATVENPATGVTTPTSPLVGVGPDGEVVVGLLGTVTGSRRPIAVRRAP
ncbi:MAG: hypothetical protein QOG68_1746, partial [Solirubrobacteraceae bacterium]|nr:hypothetical protein [Solirubrobacteraceae bacterium]